MRCCPPSPGVLLPLLMAVSLLGLPTGLLAAPRQIPNLRGHYRGTIVVGDGQLDLEVVCTAQRGMLIAGRAGDYALRGTVDASGRIWGRTPFEVGVRNGHRYLHWFVVSGQLQADGKTVTGTATSIAI